MQIIEHFIADPIGIHARPAALIAKTALSFQSVINIKANNKEVNGKGIIGIMTLGLKQGDKICLYIEGPDEEEAAKTLKAILP